VFLPRVWESDARGCIIQSVDDPGGKERQMQIMWDDGAALLTEP
jgi:hypothetical protein